MGSSRCIVVAIQSCQRYFPSFVMILLALYFVEQLLTEYCMSENDTVQTCCHGFSIIWTLASAEVSWKRGVSGVARESVMCYLRHYRWPQGMMEPGAVVIVVFVATLLFFTKHKPTSLYWQPWVITAVFVERLVVQLTAEEKLLHIIPYPITMWKSLWIFWLENWIVDFYM